MDTSGNSETSQSTIDTSLLTDSYSSTASSTQVHELGNPDSKKITECSFYWGKISASEAERLLENKAEGTFLVRDSSDKDFTYTVSFRKNGRSLHVRVEQWDDKRFSFGTSDQKDFASKTILGLIEHYSDPLLCEIGGPMLTIPLRRV